MTTASQARDFSVYDGRKCLGRIRVVAGGQARAFDSWGEPLGIFTTENEAMDALWTAKMEVEQRRP